jgi:hypothetical protein
VWGDKVCAYFRFCDKNTLRFIRLNPFKWVLIL